ncbi:melanocyte-stimulating hormone receptor-like [Exaiptasia diaphana]|uniref:G-protein coupled receptors family 1 profile domain-containing protein n=1 Tax=Exaiptasia diaphana TaxID=2652724 RepID=A0A913X331_EXADI|nr:melanocyte-stimulating hormone receptor-like [Exaiptasia diaphana]
MSPVDCSSFFLWYAYREQLSGISLCCVVIMGLLVVPIAFMNILILYIIMSKPAFHTPSNIFICNLAVSDITVAVIGIPLSITWRLYEQTSGDPEIACYLGYSAIVAGTTVSGASSLTLISAILDRYLALRFHLQYPSVVTNARVITTCILTWFSSSTIAMVIFIGMDVYDFLIASLLGPSMSLLFFAYYKIFRAVHHHQNQIHNQTSNVEQQGTFPNLSRYKKSASALLYLFVFFFIFFAPYSLFSLYHQVQGHTIYYMRGFAISVTLIYLNSALNPVICCWKIRELRRAVKKTLFQFIGKDMNSAEMGNNSRLSTINRTRDIQ